MTGPRRAISTAAAPRLIASVACSRLAAGGVEGHHAQHIRGECLVTGVVGGPQRGQVVTVVTLGQPVAFGIDRHPAGQLPELGQRDQQAPGDLPAMAGGLEKLGSGWLRRGGGLRSGR
jgi:hypothetical protein